MSLRHTAIAGLVTLALGLAGPALLGGPLQQQPPSKPAEEPKPAATPAAVPATAAPQQAAPEAAPAGPLCGDCHADQAKGLSSTRHAWGKAHKNEVPNTVCETCHGDGKAHIEAGGDKEKIYKPSGLEGANKTCLTCHDTPTARISRHAGAHANSAAVNCLTCHSIHSAEPRSPHLLTKQQLALCSNCHATQAATFRNKPYVHHVGRAGIECASCHEPHGRAGRDSLRITAAGETMPCLGCHADKRGPFVFQHGSVAIGECITCHEPHGSSNAKMLKRATVAQLCIECHSPITGTTLGSQPPSFHNLTDPRFQNCTTCHVAIHGSNRDPQFLK